MPFPIRRSVRCVNPCQAVADCPKVPGEPSQIENRGELRCWLDDPGRRCAWQRRNPIASRGQASFLWIEVRRVELSICLKTSQSRFPGRPPQLAKESLPGSEAFARQTALEQIQGHPCSPGCHTQLMDVLNVPIGTFDRQRKIMSNPFQAHIEDRAGAASAVPVSQFNPFIHFPSATPAAPRVNSKRSNSHTSPRYWQRLVVPPARLTPVSLLQPGDRRVLSPPAMSSPSLREWVSKRDISSACS